MTRFSPTFSRSSSRSGGGGGGCCLPMLVSSSLHEFNEYEFRRKVEEAEEVIRRVLDATRNPTIAADNEEHTYDDKFALAQFVTNTAIASTLQCLEGLGLDAGKLQNLRSNSLDHKRSVTLRFVADALTCKFVVAKKVNVPSRHQCVATETTTGGEADGTVKSTTHQVITEMTEYHWQVDLSYKIFAFAGNDAENENAYEYMSGRKSQFDLVVVNSREPPLPASTSCTPFDISLNWLLENLSSDNKCSFSINRSDPDCRTPRRNDDVARCLDFFRRLLDWSKGVQSLLVNDIEGRIVLRGDRPAPSVDPQSRCYLHQINDDTVFTAVLPLFEPSNNAAAAAGISATTMPMSPTLVSLSENANDAPLLSFQDVNLLLNEERQSLEKKMDRMKKHMPNREGTEMISDLEGIIVLLLEHIQTIALRLSDCLDYVEYMLKTQLIKGIGKILTPGDIEQFARHHYSKLLKSEYEPKDFSRPIQQQNHCPVGVISIEKQNSASNEPIMTIARKLTDEESRPFYVPINASTNVEIGGDRYLHGSIFNCFAGLGEGDYHLKVRARQFSSFIFLIGKISGPNTFNPENAIIVTNKDEIMIPLLLNQLPSPKAFSDAIASLSDEQKRFAKAFRSMQLENSVFGVCCIQLKPQLETLLGLPSDSITKEIKLTQDLLSMFIDYQIPSDLLSFDGDESMSTADKVAIVKGHNDSVMKMIQEIKDQDLAATVQQTDMASELRHQAQQQQSNVSANYVGFSSAMPAGASLFGSSPAPAFGSIPEPRMVRAKMATSRVSHQSVPESVQYDDVEVCEDASTQEINVSTPKKINPSDELEMAPSLGNDKLVMEDFTRLPKILDKKAEIYDTDDALCTTEIKSGDRWTKNYKKNILAKMETIALGKSGRKSEKNKAFDLLDALSRGGSLPITCAELHVLAAQTHNFSRSVMETVIQDNINPIEKMERSMLIVASTIHGKAPQELLKDDQVARVKKYSPGLFDG